MSATIPFSSSREGGGKEEEGCWGARGALAPAKRQVHQSMIRCWRSDSTPEEEAAEEEEECWRASVG